MEAPRGVELTGTNGRGTIHHASHATRPHPRTTGSTWSRNAEHETSRPSSGSRTVTRNHPPPAGGKNNRRFAAAMAQVRRPVPFRTRKLRPGTAMVLHPRGCGRVARRRIHRQGPPVEHHAPGGPRISAPTPPVHHVLPLRVVAMRSQCATHHPLFVVHCSLFTVHCSLSVGHWSLWGYRPKCVSCPYRHRMVRTHGSAAPGAFKLT